MDYSIIKVSPVSKKSTTQTIEVKKIVSLAKMAQIIILKSLKNFKYSESQLLYNKNIQES